MKKGNEPMKKGNEPTAKENKGKVRQNFPEQSLQVVKVFYQTKSLHP